jgi:Zn-dependent M16 (insulinase) family peptidase
MKYKKIYNTKYKNIDITKYKSSKSGLNITIIDLEGPIVNLNACIRTESNCDDGCPHTLEHLIFLGSEEYPYKGVLDSLANRCFARGTNAWTATDHTCYTLTTAGKEGFCNLLPVYLDHIFYPTITDSGFVTEVHHINNKGENAGVVYCEMQGRESSSSSVIYLESLRKLYPNCSYSSETGGILKDLRDLNVDTIRNYHKDYYRPDNINIIISGNVNHEEIFNSIEKFDEKLSKRLDKYKDNFVKPFMTKIEELKESVISNVKYSADSEETGNVMISFRGPKINEYLEINALDFIIRYLTNNILAPIRKEMIEIKDPYCSNIAYNLDEKKESFFYFYFCNVEYSKIENIKDKFFEVIKNVYDKEEEFNLNRIKDMIENDLISELYQLESSAEEILSDNLIVDYLYSNKNEDLDEYIDNTKRYKLLLNKPTSYWLGIIKKYMLDKKFVCVNGYPSIKYGEEEIKKEKERIKVQKEKLGEEKLKELSELLKDSINKNEVEIPVNKINEFKIPDASKIKFFDTEFKNNTNLPIKVEFDHVNSKFVTLYFFINISLLNEELRQLLPIFANTFFKSNLKVNDNILEYEEVLSKLTKTFINYSCSLYTPMYELIRFKFIFEESKIKDAIELIKNLFFNSETPLDRINVTIEKKITNIKASKKNGNAIKKYLLNEMIWNKNSSVGLTNALEYIKYLEKKEKNNKILDEYENLKSNLFSQNNMFLEIIGNKENYDNYISNMNILFEKFKEKKNPSILNKTLNLISPLEERVKNNICVPMASLETSFLTQITDGPNDFNDIDKIYLYILIEYLCTMEGIFWKEIRGEGLSYGYNINFNIETGILSFSLTKSTDVFKAYKKSLNIIKRFENDFKIEEDRLEAAKSSVIFMIIEQEDNKRSSAYKSFINRIRNLPEKSRDININNIKKTTVKDLKLVFEKYILKLFNKDKSNIVLTTSKNGYEEIIKNFNESNIEFKTKFVEDLFQ